MTIDDLLMEKTPISAAIAEIVTKYAAVVDENARLRGGCDEHSRLLLNWLESCGEAWVMISRCYDMHGKVYFGVRTCSCQLSKAHRGDTLRQALQACVDQLNDQAQPPKAG